MAQLFDGEYAPAMARALLMIVCLAVLSMNAIAAPKTQPKSAKVALPPLTPDQLRFAVEMAGRYDILLATSTKAEGFERKKDFSNAAAQWGSVRKGAEALERNAALAANVGAFREPMRFVTKKGTLTPKQYLTKMRAIAANADTRTAKDIAAMSAAQADQRKRGFTETTAGQVMLLEGEARRIAKLSKDNPERVLALINATRSIATTVRQSVVGAGNAKTVSATTRYPLKPKPLTGAELLARIDVLLADLGQRAEAQKKLVAAAAAKRKAEPTATSRTATTTTSVATNQPTEEATPSNQGPPAAPTSEPNTPIDDDVGPVGPIEGVTCNGWGPNCIDAPYPCCPGRECLPDHWQTDGTSGAPYMPSDYTCMTPTEAPRNPNLVEGAQ